MNARRRLMMAQAKKDTYIMNGLVLWMDGIDKGDIAGSWTDKVSGYVFEGVNNPTFGTNYVGVSASNNEYLVNPSTYAFTTPSSDTGTIEIVITDYYTAANTIVYMPKENGKLAFGLYDNGSRSIWSAGSSQRYVSLPNGSIAISINKLNAVVNGQSTVIETGGTYWSGANNNNFISGRNSGSNRFTGKIHAIRIYDRQLSADEMIHNHIVDNKRFNLGLTI